MSAEDLRAANAERERLRERVAEYGEEAVRTVAEAYRSFVRLLGGYEESATGTGNFQTYVEFQERVAELVEDLPEDLPEREAFEQADEALEQRTLRPKHFDRAREELDPVRNLADLLGEYEDARDRYADARRSARDRVAGLEGRIEDLERLLELGKADLDAPVERLREPIRSYDDRVREQFRTVRREESARELLSLVETAANYPLVEFRTPPERLHEFVAEAPAGEESITTLLEYADYSTSKLDHYVDRPSDLKRHVATNRTYLERLDAEPLTVGWPPPSAAELRWRCREYEAVVHRFAGEETVARLRGVRALARDESYDRLRDAAVARTELGETERERLVSGAAEADLEAARAERDDLEQALAELPEQ